MPVTAHQVRSRTHKEEDPSHQPDLAVLRSGRDVPLRCRSIAASHHTSLPGARLRGDRSLPARRRRASVRLWRERGSTRGMLAPTPDDGFGIGDEAHPFRSPSTAWSLHTGGGFHTESVACLRERSVMPAGAPPSGFRSMSRFRRLRLSPLAGRVCVAASPSWSSSARFPSRSGSCSRSLAPCDCCTLRRTAATPASSEPCPSLIRPAPAPGPPTGAARRGESRRPDWRCRGGRLGPWPCGRPPVVCPAGRP